MCPRGQEPQERRTREHERLLLAHAVGGNGKATRADVKLTHSGEASNSTGGSRRAPARRVRHDGEHPTAARTAQGEHAKPNRGLFVGHHNPPQEKTTSRESIGSRVTAVRSGRLVSSLWRGQRSEPCRAVTRFRPGDGKTRRGHGENRRARDGSELGDRNESRLAGPTGGESLRTRESGGRGGEGCGRSGDGASGPR